jgi:hypothetical protein
MEFQEEVGVTEVISKLEKSNVNAQTINYKYTESYLELFESGRKPVQTSINRP